MGIVAKNVETTTVYWGRIGVKEKKMDKGFSRGGLEHGWCPDCAAIDAQNPA